MELPFDPGDKTSLRHLESLRRWRYRAERFGPMSIFRQPNQVQDIAAGLTVAPDEEPRINNSRRPPFWCAAALVTLKAQIRGALLTCGETQELSFHRFDSGEVVRDVVLPAPLARYESEPALREGLGCTCTAEMIPPVARAAGFRARAENPDAAGGTSGLTDPLLKSRNYSRKLSG